MIASRAAHQRNLTVDGIRVNIPTMTDAVTSIMAAVKQNRSFLVFTLNLSHVVQMKERGEFYDAYKRAHFVTADGFPIAVLGRMIGIPIKRTTGSDMLVPLCEEASRSDLPIFLLGSDDSTLAKSKQRLLTRFPDLRIVGSYSPDMPFDPHSADADEAIERIKDSGARLCFLALGAPRQEVFASRCFDRVPGLGLLCFGAALDFLAGTQERAPMFAQRAGLEWAWRAIREPRRLAPRYAQCLAVLPGLVADTIPQILNTHFGKNPGTQRWRH